MNGGRLLKLTEVAERLGVSVFTLRNYYRMGRINTVMLVKRHRVTEAELAFVMKYGLRPTTEAARAEMRRKKALTRSNRRAEAARAAAPASAPAPVAPTAKRRKTA